MDEMLRSMSFHTAPSTILPLSPRPSIGGTWGQGRGQPEPMGPLCRPQPEQPTLPGPGPPGAQGALASNAASG